MRNIRIWTCSVLFLCLTAAAWADGDTRPATKAEKDYSLQMLKALSQALPKPLPGFEAQEATPLVPFERVTPGCEAEPMRVYYSVTWVNRTQQAKESAQEHEAMSRAAAKIDTASARAQQKAFMERQNKLAAELGKAIEKRDQAKIEKIQKEMEQMAKEVEKMGQAQDAVLRGETKSLTKLSLLKIRMSVNNFHESQSAHNVKELQPIGGHPAYAYHDKESKFEDCAVVLVGPWKKKIANQQLVYEAPKASLPHTRPQTLIVRVNGDPSLAGQTLRAINWKALQTLIK